MYKSVLICLWVMVLFLGGTRISSSEDMEDRFLQPDLLGSKSIFIDVKDVSLVNVLKIISKQSNLSFIASSDVADKKITLYLNKVPLNQALNTVLNANGLTYEMQEDTNVFVIKKKYQTEKTKITRVYQLKYATVSSSKLNSTISTSSSGGSGGGTSSGASTGGLEEVVKDALSPDGKIVEDARTNSLIITDVPGQFDIIESTIAKLDVPIPQILIEVEMIDVSKSIGDQLGITYGANPITFQGAQKAVNYPFSRSPAEASSISGASGGGSSSGSGTTGAFTPGSFSAAGLTAELNFLNTSTDSRTLARPRILTLNNETAQIEISADQAVSLQSVASSTTTGSSTNTITPERYTTGVILKVTPQANLLTREITMAVSPKVVDVELSVVQPSDTATNGQIYDPETRGSDSILKLRDGQSMVIGGLMRDVNSKTVTKLPFLGDLPLVGGLFRSTNIQKNERELLIFLTPHIIDDTDHTRDASDRAQEINDSLNSYDDMK